jgi:hypothetical protein
VQTEETSEDVAGDELPDSIPEVVMEHGDNLGDAAQQMVATVGTAYLPTWTIGSSGEIVTSAALLLSVILRIIAYSASSGG